MKILLIGDDISVFGGAERVIINLANALTADAAGRGGAQDRYF